MNQPRGIVGLLAACLVISIACCQNVSAESANLELRVNGLECTIDEVYSAPAPSYIVNPQDCTVPPISTSLPVASSGRQAVAESEASGAQGNQGVFENTQFESLARWVGIGNNTASPARPVIAAGALVGGVGWAADILLFDMRFSQAAIGFVRRRKSR